MLHKIDNISKLFDFANSTVYKWKKEKRPILELIDKYFIDEEIEEFLETGKIDKFEKEKLQNDFFAKYKSIYFGYIEKFGLIINLDEGIQQYYFKYLFYIKDNYGKFNIHKNPFSASSIEFAFFYKNQHNYKEVKDFHILLDLIDFLDSQPGMWLYFNYILDNNFNEWIIDIEDIEDYKINDKIADNFEKKKFPLQRKGLDHFYLYHGYNNIPPYKINDVNE